MNKIILTVTLSLVFSSVCLAQENPPAAVAPTPEAEATEKPLQKLTPGVVASYGRFTMRGKALSQGLDKNTPGDNGEAPVTGSVKRIGSTRCAAVMSNSSKEATFSVSFELSKSTKETLDRPTKRLFSATLAPGKTVEREFACNAIDILQLSLKSGREIRKSE